MKRIVFISMLFALIATLSMSALAKTHRAELISVDTLEYTLEEDDKLSAVLFIDEDGLCNFKITDLSSTDSLKPQVSITVYDGNDEIYFFETDDYFDFQEQPERKENTFILGLTEGEYKVVIENLTKFADVSFKIETSFTETEDIESKVNSSFDSATPMEFKTKYYGGVSMFGETDYFSFEMPYDGYVFIEMYTPQLKYFYLYDENGNEIGGVGLSIEEQDKIYSLRTGLAKGRYYIGITPDDDYTSPLYTVKVIPYEQDYFEKEFNNSKEYATPVQFRKEYQGNMFGYDDKDIYSFVLHTDSSVVIDFTDTQISKEKHYKIRLTDGQSEIFSSDECGKKTIAENLSKGTYYFIVESLGHKNYTDMAYKISVTADNHLAICPDEEESAGSDENEPAEENILPFADVKETDWYYDELLEAKKLGLIEGVGDNIYNPKGNVTLAEAVTMAARILGSSDGNPTVLTDESDGKWYSSYITYAVNGGILNREDFDDFERPATRAEVAYIFSNLFDDIKTEKNTVIPDVNEDTKYCENIHKLYALGILKGDDEKGTFYPERTLTRAEAAIILLRIHKA